MLLPSFSSCLLLERNLIYLHYIIVIYVEMSQEKLYRDVCLSTFHTFTTATDLFKLLIERFHMVCPSVLSIEEAAEWREKKLVPVQKR